MLDALDDAKVPILAFASETAAEAATMVDNAGGEEIDGTNHRPTSHLTQVCSFHGSVNLPQSFSFAQLHALNLSLLPYLLTVLPMPPLVYTMPTSLIHHSCVHKAHRSTTHMYMIDPSGEPCVHH